MRDRAQEEKPADRRATTLLVGLLPAGLIVAVSFVQAEILHRSWIAWGHHYIAVLFPLMWLVGRVRDGEEQNAKSLAPVAMGCALLGSLFVVSGLVGALPRLLASYSLFGALIVAFAFAFRFVTAQRT